MMQRKSIAKFNICFTYSQHDESRVEHIDEDISAPEEFYANYRSLCELSDKVPKSPFKIFESTPYSIIVSGTLNDKPFTKTFTNLNDYLGFLQRQKLLPDKAPRKSTTF